MVLVDLNPVLTFLGRCTLPAGAAVVEAELRDVHWTDQTGGGFYAALSATALAWFEPTISLASTRGLLRAGGLCVNADPVPNDELSSAHLRLRSSTPGACKPCTPGGRPPRGTPGGRSGRG